MISRFKRIHHKFGIAVSARIALLVVGLLGMSLMGALVFESLWPAVAAVVGIAAGWLLRRQIVDWFDALSWALPAALFVYGIVLFVGERLGLTSEYQLLIITLTTVIILDLQFWWFSDPSIVKNDDDAYDVR